MLRFRGQVSETNDLQAAFKYEVMAAPMKSGTLCLSRKGRRLQKQVIERYGSFYSNNIIASRWELERKDREERTRDAFLATYVPVMKSEARVEVQQWKLLLPASTDKKGR